jgi:flagella basal body P-ring formation protein FlgA
MLRIMSLAGLLLLASASAQAEALRPSLKPAATVTADVVTVGDLVAQAGKFAEEAIFRSPDLGTTGTVPAAQVLEALRPFGLGDLAADGITEVTVTRPGRAITAKQVEHRIVQALAGQHGLGAAEDLRVSIDQPLRTFSIEPSATAELQVLRLTVDPFGSRFHVMLDVPGSAILRRTPLRLSGRVTETAETAVLTRSLQRGDVLRRGDISIERRPRAEVGRDDISRIEQAVGLAARRPLRGGQPLRQGDLMKPELVQRDETVTLLYQAPGVLLTMRGKAVEAGAEGEVIAVLNLQSKRTVHGAVTGYGQVTVSGTSRAGPTKTARLQPSTQPNRPE